MAQTPISTTSTVTSTTTSQYVVENGGKLTIGTGGNVTATIVEDGGALTVASGVESGAIVSAFGAVTVDGGTAGGDQLTGSLTVTSGAAVSNETIYNGGLLQVLSGTATGTTVGQGGTLLVSGGGTTATNTTLSGGGTVELDSGKATVNGALSFTGGDNTLLVNAAATAGYGDQAVISGFTATDAIDVTSGATAGAAVTLHYATSVVSGVTDEVVTISNTTKALATFIFSGTTYNSADLSLVSDGNGGVELLYNADVISAGASNNLTIASGQADYLSGVAVTSTAVQNGGVLAIGPGGVDASATIFSGGVERVLGGATAAGDHVSGGGVLIISGGGVENSAIISAGGTEILSAAAGSAAVSGDQISGALLTVSGDNGVLTSETVYGGGLLELQNANNATGTTVLNGGVLLLNGHETATDTVLSGGGAIVLDSPKATIAGSGTGAGAGLTFEGVGNTLEINALGAATSGSTSYGEQAVISGFSSYDTIDLTTVAFAAGATSVVDSASGVNTVANVMSGGVIEETFTFAGTNYAGTLSLVADAGGTGVDLETTVPCYCRGARVLTENGYVEVETLKIGDKLITAWGERRPITWIGTRSYDGRFITGNKLALPIRFAPGSLGESAPFRDLWVSPWHSMYLEGVLIPAKELVDGVLVTQAAHVERVDYFHIELESHDLILAEGAVSESYVEDWDNRGLFHNAAEYEALYPDAVAAQGGFCAPQVCAGPEVEEARRKIAVRGAQLARLRIA